MGSSLRFALLLMLGLACLVVSVIAHRARNSTLAEPWRSTRGLLIAAFFVYWGIIITLAIAAGEH